MSVDYALGPDDPEDDDDYECPVLTREEWRETLDELCDEAGMKLEDLLVEGRAGHLVGEEAHRAYWWATLYIDDAK